MLLVELTEAGRQVAREFRLLVHQQQKAWLEPLTAQEQDQLISALHRLQDALGDTKP